jgi:hypothetical protein
MTCHMAFVQLSQGHDEFWWNLHENGKFLVEYMHKALFYSNALVLDNKQTWKIEVPLKITISRGIFVEV